MHQPPLARCPCCGFRTGCRTCPVCYWTDDGQSDRDLDASHSATNAELSLRDARLNYSIYGACAQRYRDLVRPPRPEERP